MDCASVNKIQYKDRIFKLSGHDILVVPNKYVAELRNMPDEQLSSIQANIDVTFALSAIYKSCAYC
jgi:hypothetical protein